MNRHDEIDAIMRGTKPGVDGEFWAGVINGGLIVAGLIVFVWLVW